MAYDRYESRRGWRDPRSRFGDDFRERGEDRFGRDRGYDRDDDRGFFERAGDEIASWFGDDEAERRRREDSRFGRSDEDFSNYERSPRFRDEGYRRPYTGRFAGRRNFGGDDRFDRGTPPERGWSERWERAPSRREFSGTAAGLHDPHYSEWRQQQIEALDRDYDEYRRENQGRFENEFAGWRSTREGKRKLLGEVREQMNVVGSDEEHLGTVDHVRSDRIILSKGDSEDSRHHVVSCSLVDRVEGDRVILDRPAAEVKQRFESDDRDRGFFRDEERESGPHMLNRAFSGTYER